MQKHLYIIAGCNGAGKTTASFNILPTLLQCREYVNADEIARGISPFQPEKVAFEAGRIMLTRIEDLLKDGENFAFETTLATKSFAGLIKRAKQAGYNVTLMYFWLESTDLAEQRVNARVAAGGHNIPADVIRRRYYRGINNLFNLYQNLCDMVLVYDNSKNLSEPLFAKRENTTFTVYNDIKFNTLKSLSNEH